jgi:translation elongation factor EF-1beta
MLANESGQRRVVLDTVIEFVMEQMAYRVRKFEMKRLVSLLLYGPSPDNDEVPLQNMDQSVFEEICSKARERTIERIAVAKKDALIDSISFYESVLAKPHVPEKTKIRAQENLDKLHSLISIKIKLDDSDSVNEDEMAKAIQDKLRERFNGTDSEVNKSDTSSAEEA